MWGWIQYCKNSNPKQRIFFCITSQSTRLASVRFSNYPVYDETKSRNDDLWVGSGHNHVLLAGLAVVVSTQQTK
jgi:hypothetical protein